MTRLALESLETRCLLTTTISEVMQFDRDEIVVVENANSTLTRSHDDLTLRVSTNGLAEGTHRLSIASFNNPDLCTADCDLATDDVPEVDASLIQGQDVVVGADGRAEFSVSFSEGADPAVLSGSGVLDATKAEIGFVIHACDAAGDCPDPVSATPVQQGTHINPETVVTTGPARVWDHPGGKNDIPVNDTTTRITRYQDHVALRFDTRELVSGDVYTFWLGAFNTPDGCLSSPLCTPSEFPAGPFTGPPQEGRPESRPSLLNVTGQWVQDSEGRATFIGERQVGDTGGVVLFGPALEDAWEAELHAVVRTHGEAVADPPTEQLTTFNGGCPPNQCANLQLAASKKTSPPAPSVMITQTNASGFSTEFSTELDESLINLYDTESGDFGPSDLIVEGETTGVVAGSLVLGPGRATFIKSGGPLPADIYTLTYRSGEGGITSTSGGHLQNEAGVVGDFSTSFVVDEPAADAIVVSLPDFVRGPGHNIHLPADSSAGIPLTLSDGDGVRSVQLTIDYDPTLLEITAATVAAGLPSGATAELDVTTPGEAIISFTSPGALPEGEATIVSLEATVPFTPAVYGRQQILDIHSTVVTDGEGTPIPVVEDDALQLASYFGDVSGNGTINAGDASRLARVAALIDSGFEATPRTEVRTIADISGNGVVNALDASLLAQFAALLPVPEIPPIPTNAASIASLQEALDASTAEDGFTLPVWIPGEASTGGLAVAQGVQAAHGPEPVERSVAIETDNRLAAARRANEVDQAFTDTVEESLPPELEDAIAELLSNDAER